MFRVPLDTVLRRASVAGLLVLATALSACGDDAPKKADGSDGQGALSVPGGDVSEAPEGTSPTTPEATDAPASNETDEVLPGGVKAVKLTAAQAKVITDHVENKDTIARASAKKLTSAQTKADISAVRKALGSATGKKVETVPPGESGNIGQLLSGDIRVMFFESDRKATEATRGYQQLIATRPGFGRADVAGSRLWLLTVPTKVKQADITRFRKVRKAVEAKV